MTGRAATLVMLLAAAAPARAGGLARPSVITARGIGMGGAFVAVADDPTALHFNPAGLALLPHSVVMLGVELVKAPRRYTPVLPDGTTGPDEEPSAPIRPLPVIGAAARLPEEGAPSRLAFGIGLWNSFGGQLEYARETEPVPAINSTTDAMVEVVAGAAYEVNDVLAVGAAFRFGIGLFDVDATAKPVDTVLSARGFGAGASFGVMVKPSRTLQLGAVYRTAITPKLSGDGTIAPGGSVLPVKMEHDQNWPQQAACGFAWAAAARLRLVGELDWTGWSRFDELLIAIPGNNTLDQRFDLDWNDSLTLRLGGEYHAGERLDLRAGWAFDGNAIPDRTIERQYIDGNKMMFTAGASIRLGGGWRADTAFEYVHGSPRTVEDNRAEAAAAGWVERANHSPGEHVGQVYTLELAGAYEF